MEQTDRDFWQAVRSFLLRYAEYNREKGASVVQVEEFEQTQARLLAGGELKEAVVSRLAGLELKCDYHNLIMLSLLQDLAKCTCWRMQGRRSITQSYIIIQDQWIVS